MTELYSDATDPEAMAKRLQKLERQVLALKTALSLENASVGAGGTRYHSGGGIDIDDGGSITLRGGAFQLENDDATVLAFFGLSPSGFPIWGLSFPTGDIALGLVSASDPGFWGGFDNDGNIIVANDAVSGAGLSRPYLTMRMVPSPSSTWPVSTATTAGSAIKLWQGINVIENPRIVVGVNMTSDAGTPHWRLDINGVTVDADNTGIGAFEYDIPNWNEEGGINPGDAVGIDIYGWVTGGGTQMQLLCDRLHGDQS